MVKLFHHFSCHLCATDDLPLSLANEYYAVLAAQANFTLVLQLYKEILDQQPQDLVAEIKARLVTNAEYRTVIKAIIKLWYLGRVEGMKELKGPKHYYHYDALIWRVLQAHPPGLSGGYFGYWAYKPEE